MSEPLPLISIFCFVRNGAKTIRRCVDSVLALDYPNFEFVIQDGASTDGTLEVLQDYAGRHPGIVRLVSEPDSCSDEALFRAFSRCRGEFIGSCLADEALMPQAARWALEAFARNSAAGAVYGDLILTDAEGKVTGEFKAPRPFSVEKYLLHEVNPPFASSFFRRPAVEAIGLRTHPWKLGMGEFELWARLALRYQVVHVPGLVATYAVHPGQLSAQKEVLLKQLALRCDYLERLFSAKTTRRRFESILGHWAAGVHLFFAEVLRDAGTYAEAAELLSKAMSLHPNAERSKQVMLGFLHEGMRAAAQGRHRDALTCLDPLRQLGIDIPGFEAIRRQAAPLAAPESPASVLARMGKAPATGVDSAGRRPLVSVIVLCHNYAAHLRASVESVLAQTFRDFELIIVDDGSTDDSLKVARELAAQHGHAASIQVLHLSDVGPSAARNAAVEKSRGRYFLPLDADDRLAPAFLEKTVPVLEANAGAGFAYTDAIYFGDTNRHWVLPEYDFKRLCAGNYVSCCSLVRRAAFDAVGRYDASSWAYYEDWELWIRLGKAGWHGRHVGEPLFLYNQHTGSSLSLHARRLDPVYRALRVSQHPGLHPPAAVEAAKAALAEMHPGWQAMPPPRDIAQISGLLRGSPGNRHLLYFLALAQSREGLAGDAVATLKTLVSARPSDTQARELLESLGSKMAGALDPAPAGTNWENLRGRRVLLYTDDPGEGGAAHYNHSLLAALVGSGAYVCCAQPRASSPLIDEQARLGVTHVWTGFNPVAEFARSFTDEADSQRILALARPDLVFFSDCCALSHVAAKRSAVRRGTPFVAICHSEAAYLAERFPQVLPAVKELMARASSVIAVSHNSLAVLSNHFGLAPDKGQVIYSGCGDAHFAPADPQKRARLRAGMDIPDDAVLCITAARLDAGKGFPFQLDAIRRLSDSGRLGSLHFAWAGDGSLRRELEDAVKASGLGDRIKILGYRWDVIDLMGASDAFILTTLHEALPLCIMEAMARGLPVLASAVGGIPEEMGTTGVLLPDPNVDPRATSESLAEALCELESSAEARQAMGAAGKERARALFASSRMVLATLEVLGRALPRPGAPAQGPARAEDLFDAGEVANIERLVASFTSNPSDTAVAAQLRQLQEGLADFLAAARPERLEGLFNGSFGTVFRVLSRSGLPTEPPSEGAQAWVARLDHSVAESEARDGPLDVCSLLARMLFTPAHRGRQASSLAKLPSWLVADYLEYLLRAPLVCVTPGEAEMYHDHLLGLARSLCRMISADPSQKLAQAAASAFTLKANLIPVYTSRANVRELAEKRASIMEFALARAGNAIDHAAPVRPGNRERIKVGFLNAHFGAQTETHVTLPSLQLDREKFEVCLFALAGNPDPIEERCRSFSDSLTLLPASLDGQVKAIRDSSLDVLIIGTNVTAVTNQVSLIAVHRLAPLQLVSYCSPTSTGMRHVDGYLTGTLLDLPRIQEHFSERLIPLEGGPGCLDYAVERGGSPNRATRQSLGLGRDDVVFVNGASCFKILPEMIETWARILRSVPGSRLLLLPFNPNWAATFPFRQFEQMIARACARHGLDRNTFVLTKPLASRADVKAVESLGDVYLDLFPFSGSISLVDPLELGIPAVVWEGATHRSRAGSALLREVGVTELIADDEESYVQISVRLATDFAYRRHMSGRITAAMAARPRFTDPRAYALELGNTLESALGRSGAPDTHRL